MMIVGLLDNGWKALFFFGNKFWTVMDFSVWRRVCTEEPAFL